MISFPEYQELQKKKKLIIPNGNVSQGVSIYLIDKAISLADKEEIMVIYYDNGKWLFDKFYDNNIKEYYKAEKQVNQFIKTLTN